MENKEKFIQKTQFRCMSDENNERKVLGARLKEERKRMGLTQAALAEKLNIGSSHTQDGTRTGQNYISAMETGKRKVSNPVAEDMAKLCGCDKDYFLDVNVVYRNLEEKLFNERYVKMIEGKKSIKKHIRKWNSWEALIISMAESCGYEVEKRDPFVGGLSFDEIFSRIKEYLIISRDGEKIASLSQEEVQHKGEYFSELSKVVFRNSIIGNPGTPGIIAND